MNLDPPIAKYPSGGRASFHPIMMTKLIIKQIQVNRRGNELRAKARDNLNSGRLRGMWQIKRPFATQ